MTEQSPVDRAGDEAGDETGDGAGVEAADARRETVGEGLRAAFAALANPEIPDADRARRHQRLIAITNSAKHDLATAEARLRRYQDDVDAELGAGPDR